MSGPLIQHAKTSLKKIYCKSVYFPYNFAHNNKPSVNYFLGVWSEDLFIKTISHDEIIPLPIAKYLENFNVSRNIEDSRRRPKWLKENGKHYIYYHGTNGSRGIFNEYNSVLSFVNTYNYSTVISKPLANL